MTTPSTWRKIQLGLLGDFKNGVNFGKEKMGEGIRLINVKDIFSDIPKINFDSLDKVALSDRKGIEKFHVNANDIFLVRSSVKRDGIGLATMAQKDDNETVHCGFVIRFRLTNSEVDSQFLTYLLRSPHYRKLIIGLSSGTAIINISQDSLSSLIVNLPSLSIQQKIASILSAYDSLIENNRRRIQLLEQSARLLYREWFVHLRFPGHEHVRIIDGVPEGWETRMIGELTVVVNRGITPEYDDEGEFTVINQKCIRNGELNIELARQQKKVFKDEKQVKFGDILINSTGTGTLGRIAQLWTDIPKCTIDSHVTIVRPREDLEKLWFGFSILPLENVFGSMGEGSTNQTELNPRKIREMTLLIPKRELRLEFEKFATDITDQISNLKSQEIKLTSARDILLPRLMNGEITV